MAVEEKLTTTRFNVDIKPHIRINTEMCESCQEQACLYICPAQNYILSDNKITFSWQGCLECGACRISCTKGAIDWSYPRGGFGVFLRYG